MSISSERRLKAKRPDLLWGSPKSSETQAPPSSLLALPQVLRWPLNLQPSYPCHRQLHEYMDKEHTRPLKRLLRSPMDLPGQNSVTWSLFFQLGGNMPS